MQSVSIFVKFCPSVSPFVFAVLFIPPFNGLSSYFCFTQFGGSSHCLNFDKFRDIAPLRSNENQIETVVNRIPYSANMIPLLTIISELVLPNQIVVFFAL